MNYLKNEKKQVKLYHGSTQILKDFELFIESWDVSFSNELGQPLKDIQDKFEKSVVGKVAQGLSSIREASQGAQASNGGENRLDIKSKEVNVKKISFMQPGTKRISPYSNIKSWRGTSPLSFSLKFEFKYGQYDLWDAGVEVRNPIIELANLGLPDAVKGGFLRGPLPTDSYYWGLVIGNILGTVNSVNDKAISDANKSKSTSKWVIGIEEGGIFKKEAGEYPTEEAAKQAAGARGATVPVPEKDPNDPTKTIYKAVTTSKYEARNINIDTDDNSIAAEKLSKSFLDTLAVWESKLSKVINDGFNASGVEAKGLIKVVVGPGGKIFNQLCFVKDASYNFDYSEVDSSGYPLSGEVTLNMETVTMANTSMFGAPEVAVAIPPPDKEPDPTSPYVPPKRDTSKYY